MWAVVVFIYFVSCNFQCSVFVYEIVKLRRGFAMRGIQSTCSICGVTGEVYGCPSFWDVCSDKDGCRERAVAKERRKVQELEKRVKELESADIVA